MSNRFLLAVLLAFVLAVRCVPISDGEPLPERTHRVSLCNKLDFMTDDEALASLIVLYVGGLITPGHFAKEAYKLNPSYYRTAGFVIELCKPGSEIH